MIRAPLLLLLTSSLVLSGCSSLNRMLGGYEEPERLQEIGSLKLRLMSNEPLAVDHESVINSYKSYLEVSEDPEMRVRVAHRIAGLKLDWDEIRGDEEIDNLELFAQEDRDLAEASIQDYVTLVTDYPQRPDNDVIYYQLARAYSLTGRINLAINALLDLTEKFPESEYFLESQFRLGRLLYAVGDFEASAEHFAVVISTGTENNPYYMDAQYLQGWSIFKQARYEDSLLAFTAMLDEHFPDDEVLRAAEGSELEILNDTLRIMALMFDYMGEWNDIAAFYDVHGPRYYEYRIYAELSNQYYDKKYFRNSAATLLAFVDRYPDDDLAVLYYRRLIDGYEKANYPVLQREHKATFIDRFGVGSDYWNTHDEAVRTQITVALGDYLWDLSNFHHGSGQASDDPQLQASHYTEAAHWYREYIRSFPNAPDAVQAEFYLAEVTYSLGLFAEARDNYEIVAYQYPYYEQASEAGYAALLAYAEHEPAEEERAVWRQQHVASALRFVEEFKDDPRRGSVLVNAGEMLLADGYYQKALETARYAQTPAMKLEGRYAYGADLVQGHAAFELNEFAESEQALLRASEWEYIDLGRRADLRQKAAAAIYQQGEAVRDSDPALAVSHWLRIQNVVPESTIRENAEYDAATLLMVMGDHERAERVLLSFRNDHPQSPLQADVPDKLILVYEAQEKWLPAADELEGIAMNGEDRDTRRIATYQAAEYYEKGGDDLNAIRLYKVYANGWKEPFEPSLEAHYRLDQIYKKQGEEAKRRFWLDKIIALHLGAGDDQTERSAYLASQAAFELGEFERQRFETVGITLPLSRSIVAKNSLMQASMQRYTQAVEMEVLDFTTPSTFHIGDMYAQFSRGLLESERPRGMDELEAEEYQFLLEDEAFPLEEAAIRIHQTNIARAYDGLYDEWVKRSFKSLAELMPGQYDKTEKATSYVKQIR